ncbi:MAG: hypothetical protein E7197_09885 [Anaerovibrio sp.]|uniref:hypothetical protein n=1 Tax=Anaerovibrio sp. TaxID=1872532 RepID=UPI0025C5814E|nr:hypothetical protein [Anaerovibrio sp.]MBE6100349.1 hypothetical protein [Anaerovibrio sp.]
MKTFQKFADKHIDNGVIAGIINFSLILVNVLVTTVMWQMAGVPYNGAFTVIVLCALLGTIAAAYYRLAVVVAPGIVLNSFLCYDLVISQGFSWQEVMAVPLLAGLAVLLLSLSGRYRWLKESLPDYLAAVIPATLGVFLIYRGLIMSHLVIAAPDQITGMGSLNDPLIWVALPSLLVIMGFLSYEKEYGLSAGLLTAVLVAVLYGLLSLPEYLFSLPEGLLDTAFQVSFNEVIRLSGPILVVFLVLVFEGLALGKVMGGNCEEKLLKINGMAGLLGGLISGGALSVAEVTAACRFKADNPGRPALVSAGLLLLLLFCAPMAMVLAKYPVITGAVVMGAGCYLLMDLKIFPFNDNISILAGVFTIILVPLWGNLTAGIGFGLVLYSFLMVLAGRGRELSKLLWLIIGMFAIYFCYNI